MFATDVVDLDTAQTLSAAAGARAAENDANVDRLLFAAHYADLHPGPAIPASQYLPGGERCMIYGGPGCPGIAEFAVAEYGVVLGVSPESAAKDIGQALALRHRLPRTWAAVLARTATAWKARLIATACLALSQEAAAIVDRRVAAIVDSVSPLQLRNIVKAAIWQADPDAARAAAEQQARERGVWAGRSDEHGTTTLFVKAATGDVIRLNATLTQIADALTALGDPDPLQTRRAKAIGILADPALADQLLQVAHYLATHRTTTGQSATPEATTEPTEPTKPTEPTEPTEATSPTTSTPAGEAATDHATSTTPSPQPATSTPGPDTTHTEPGLDGDVFLADEPSPHAEADRDTPHPSHPAHPLDPPTPTTTNDTNPRTRAGTSAVEQIVSGMNAAARHDLTAKLAAIKHTTNTNTTNRTRPRPGTTKLYIHLTDETLLAGHGVTRIETFGPALAHRLTELLGHDHITIQPVIDLNNHLNVNAYEIPRRLREHIKLTHPVEQFPYGPGETTTHTDLDHVTPYNPTGPPGQTSTTNLKPLRRLSHRIKTHAGWTVQTINNHTLQWTTPHGHTFHVNHTGTHPVSATPNRIQSTSGDES